MARKKKLIGPDGTKYDVSMLRPDIVEEDKIVQEVFDLLEAAQKEMIKARNVAVKKINEYLDAKASEYGAKWKGSATLKSFDESRRIDRKVTQARTYGSDVVMARELIDQYIDEQKKKASKTRSEEVKQSVEEMSALLREGIRLDESGNANAKRLEDLRKLNISDPKFKKAMEIVAGARKDGRKKTYYNFSYVGDDGKKQALVMNFNQL